MEMNKNMMNAISTIAVHGGVFHADDVVCVAMAKIMKPEIAVKRVFKVDGLDEKTLVCDIGGGRYDHHQADAECREDGRKHAACGLLFREIKNDLFPTEDAASAFEQDYIIPIEDADNGVCRNPLSTAIAGMNPDWDSNESVEEAFSKAVDFAKGIILSEIKRAESAQRAVDIVQKALDESDGDIVILPQFAPWASVLVPSTARFVIFPSNRGGYNLQTIPVPGDGFTAKKSLPEGWLAEKPEGCTFVHPARFISAFDTEEHAVKAAALATE